MPLLETIPLQKAKIIKKSCWVVIIPVWNVFVLSLPQAKQVFSQNPLFLQAGILLAVLIFFGVPVYQWLYFKRYYYDLNEQMLTVRKGVVTQKEITLPFSRITDVYIDQDFLDVLFKLCDVHVSTPTSESGLFAHIDGVSKEDGEKLKALILEHVNKKTS